MTSSMAAILQSTTACARNILECPLKSTINFESNSVLFFHSKMKGAKNQEPKSPSEVKPEAPWGNSTFEAESREVNPTSEYSTTYYAKFRGSLISNRAKFLLLRLKVRLTGRISG